MNPIVLAIVVLVVLGLAGGVILVLASKFMAVYEAQPYEVSDIFPLHS